MKDRWTDARWMDRQKDEWKIMVLLHILTMKGSHVAIWLNSA